MDDSGNGTRKKLKLSFLSRYFISYPILVPSYLKYIRDPHFRSSKSKNKPFISPSHPKWGNGTKYPRLAPRKNRIKDSYLVSPRYRRFLVTFKPL